MDEKQIDQENGTEEKNSGGMGKKPAAALAKGSAAVQKTLLTQKIVIGVLAAVVVAGGGLTAAGLHYGWFGDNGKQEKNASADIDPDSGEWDGTIPEAPKGDPNAKSIALPGYPQIYIPAGQTDVEVAFANPEGNPCYFTFQLVLKDSQEVLYESKQVPPGEAIQKITLSRSLDAGEYPAVLKISTNSIADMSEMNGADMETTLKVQ